MDRRWKKTAIIELIYKMFIKYLLLQGTLQSSGGHCVNYNSKYLLLKGTWQSSGGRCVNYSKYLILQGTWQSSGSHCVNYSNYLLLQGTWQSSGGRCVNYIVLKENLENRIDITKVFSVFFLFKCSSMLFCNFFWWSWCRNFTATSIAMQISFFFYLRSL